jgi:GxxExxY protein
VVKEEDRLSKEVIGAAIEVHRHLGPGMLESAYEECLCKELEIRDIAFKRQKPLPVAYKGITLDCGYKLDEVAEGKVILEFKSVNKLEPIHDAQLLTYLKLCALGVFAVNFFSGLFGLYSN